MPVALALLTLAVLITVSGLQGKSIVDTLGEGITPLNPAGGPISASDVEASLAGQSTINPAANLTQNANIGGGGISLYDGKRVASWIVPTLDFARTNGYWRGRVTSGLRTEGEQQALRENPAGYPVASGRSNHQGIVYPDGAVDVSDPEGLNNGIRHYPGHPTLVWGANVIGDRVHFSATGR